MPPSNLESLSRSSLRWITLLLAAATLYLCWPLWPSLVLATWTAALARPIERRMASLLGGRRRAAGVLSLLVFMVVALPVTVIGLGVLAGARDLAVALSRSTSARAALESLTTSGHDSGTIAELLSPAGLVALAQRYGTQALSMLGSVAGAAAQGTVGLLLYFAGAYTFLVDDGAVWAWTKRHAPLAPDHLERFAAAYHETGRGLLVGVGLTTLAQGAVATVIYLALGVPRWWVLGPITGLASMIPVIGSGMVWGPVAAGLALGGQVGRAAVLAALGLGVIGTIDNVLRPVFARMGALQLPTFLLFVSLFGGLMAFGSWGALLGPLIVRLLVEALILRREMEAGEPSAQVGSVDASLRPSTTTQPQEPG